jgi:alkylhydroperoxidase/carboxymuconolactone decarboxylase family protein YurZ
LAKIDKQQPSERRDAKHDFDHLAEFSAPGYDMIFGAPPPSPAPPGSLADLTQKLIYGHLYQRGVLSMRERRIAVLCLVACRHPAFLSSHIRATLAKNELTAEELDEVAVQVAFYGGWPVGNAFRHVIEEVLASQSEDK